MRGEMRERGICSEGGRGGGEEIHVLKIWLSLG